MYFSWSLKEMTGVLWHVTYYYTVVTSVTNFSVKCFKMKRTESTVEKNCQHPKTISVIFMWPKRVWTWLISRGIQIFKLKIEHIGNWISKLNQLFELLTQLWRSSIYLEIFMGFFAWIQIFSLNWWFDWHRLIQK